MLKRLRCLWLMILIEGITTVTNNGNSDLDQFSHCIRNKQYPALSECVGQTALNFIQRLDEHDNYTLTNEFVVKKDERAATRSLVNLFDTDPIDFRGILENAGAVLGQRSLEWHMDGLYPGLMFKVGPTVDANSVAEFVIDPAENERTLNYAEPSTARTLTKLYLLPLLLSLKLNLVALVPIVFTVILLLLKKSLFLIKLILFVSSVVGLGGTGAAFGGLGALGLGGLGLGGLSRPSFLNTQAANSWGGPNGFLPGKSTIFNEEYEQRPPYKRNGRKVQFERPRELPTTTPKPSITPNDHFYDYEKLLYQIQDSSKPSNPADFERSAKQLNVHTPYNTNDALGWKVINLTT